MDCSVLEKAGPPQAQGQSPRQEPGLCSATRQSCAFPAAPSAPELAGPMATQDREGAQQERPAAFGPVPSQGGSRLCSASTLGPSCLSTDLIRKAATASGALGGGWDDWQGEEFLSKGKRRRKAPGAENAALAFSRATGRNPVRGKDSPAPRDFQGGLQVGTPGSFPRLRLSLGQDGLVKRATGSQTDWDSSLSSARCQQRGLGCHLTSLCALCPSLQSR